jgi:hypothetical protein
LQSETGGRREGHKGTKWMKEQKNRVEEAVLTKGVGGSKKGVNGGQIDK